MKERWEEMVVGEKVVVVEVKWRDVGVLWMVCEVGRMVGGGDRGEDEVIGGDVVKVDKGDREGGIDVVGDVRIGMNDREVVGEVVGDKGSGKVVRDEVMVGE